MKRKIFVIGDSHTRVLGKAEELRVQSGDSPSECAFDIHWILTKKGDKSRGDMPLEEAVAIAKALGPDDIVVISLAGTLHNIFGLLRHDPPFDFYTADDDHVESGTQIIPFHAVKDLLYDSARNNRNIIAIKKAASCRIFHLPTPAPKEDNEFIQEKTVRYRDRFVLDAGINSPAIRLKLWELEMEVVEELCREWGMSFIPAPLGSQTDAGFLKKDYYGADATHANEAYGQLVLRQLEDIALGAGAT